MHLSVLTTGTMWALLTSTVVSGLTPCAPKCNDPAKPKNKFVTLKSAGPGLPYVLLMIVLLSLACVSISQLLNDRYRACTSIALAAATGVSYFTLGGPKNDCATFQKNFKTKCCGTAPVSPFVACKICANGVDPKKL
jgi:hypothetical protein